LKLQKGIQDLTLNSLFLYLIIIIYSQNMRPKTQGRGAVHAPFLHTQKKGAFLLDISVQKGAFLLDISVQKGVDFLLGGLFYA